MTNDPNKVTMLEDLEIGVPGRVPVIIPAIVHGSRYLPAKTHRFGQLLLSEPTAVPLPEWPRSRVAAGA
jgi:hypothetical protein